MKAVIQIQEKFSFTSVRWFKDQYEKALGKDIDVDFSGCKYLDSSALGMLLMLRDRAAPKTVTLVGCKGDVKKILEIAQFGKLFKIS